MARYRACGTVCGSKYIGEYEAKDKDQAEELAWRDADVSLCHQCSNEVSDSEITEIFVEEIEDE